MAVRLSASPTVPFPLPRNILFQSLVGHLRGWFKFKLSTISFKKIKVPRKLSVLGLLHPLMQIPGTIKQRASIRFHSPGHFTFHSQHYSYVRFVVLAAVPMKNAVFSDVGTQFIPHMRHNTSPLQSEAG
jgi:hypothetical protein